MEEIQSLANENSGNDCDSIALGSATKGGAIKVYGNFKKPDEFKSKIDKAIEVRKYANAKISINI